ncbi:MAG: hypothetical protein O7G13_04760 [Alphaproteobacteria bacterium]|nr:hypothetical protein [Alphaproteobacteria bacterium]
MYDAMPETKEISFVESGSFFENLLDIINPLQHIPVVSTIYRAITGDQIAAPARLIGGALFGGPLGFASASASLLLEEVTGDDLAGHALALVGELDDTLELASAAASSVTVTPLAPPPTPLSASLAALQAEPRAATNLAATDDGAEIIWNGPRVLLSLARLTAAVEIIPASNAALANLAVADDGAEIVWNAPRVLPSRARSTAAVEISPASDTALANLAAADDGAEIMWNSARALASQARGVVVQSGSADDTTPDFSGAGAPVSETAIDTSLNLSARPAWLKAAIADAQMVQSTAQLGKAAQKVEAQPWITEAMLEALAKYEKLALERSR